MALVDIFVDVLDPLDRSNTLYVDMATVLPEQKDAKWNDKTIVDLLATGKSVCLSSITTAEALVDVFVNVFDPLDRPNTLYVDMASVLPEQKDAEWNDKTIVDLLATGKSVCLSSITTAEIGIRVIGDGGLVMEWLGKTFGALAVLHAGSIGILSTTGSMDYVLHHQFMELRIDIRIRNLSREEFVKFIRSVKLGIRMEENNEMGVRQATLLKFIGVAIANGLPQTSYLHDVIEHLITLHVENSTDNVWTISRLLARKKG